MRFEWSGEADDKGRGDMAIGLWTNHFQSLSLREWNHTAPPSGIMDSPSILRLVNSSLTGKPHP